MSALSKIINAFLALPITIICALSGTLIFVMGVAAVFDEGEPFGLVFIGWYITGILGIVGLWKLALKFQWKEIKVSKKEWILLGFGYVACTPFPFFITWNPNEPYGFIIIYLALFMALILSISVGCYSVKMIDTQAEPSSADNGDSAPPPLTIPDSK